MKNTIVILLLLSFNVLNAQTEDLQWLVRDGHFKIGGTISNNTYSSSSLGPIFNISRVSFPRIPTTSSGSMVTYANQFFVIYENGTYGLINETHSPVYNPNGVRGYNMTLGNIGIPAKYIYLTNVYEEDDPPENVTISNSTTSEYKNVTLTNTTNYFGTIHDIVLGKDFTIIIDGDDIPSGEIYKLCHNNLPQVQIDPSQFANGYNHIKYGSTPSDPTSFDIANCLTIEGNGENQFLNFQARTFAPTRFKDLSIVFKLFSVDIKGDTTEIRNQAKTISSKFHDPNYVKVKCVWKEADECFVKYEVFCYNDGTGPVDKVSMSMILPPAVSSHASAISGVKVNVGNNSCCTDVKVDYLNNNLNLTYKGDLKSFKGKITPDVSVKFEFCAKLNASVCSQITTVDLQPTTPTTCFQHNGNTAFYPIEVFIDPMSEFDEKDCTTEEQNNYCYSNVITTQKRAEAKCGPCKCKQSWKCGFWPWKSK